MGGEQLFKKEYARELHKIAEGDLVTAEVLLAAKRGRLENICFAAQQVVEKSIKAVLCSQGKPVPFTHTIELLLDRLGTQSHPPHGDALISLTDYATTRRYQEGSEILTDEDLNAAVDAAKKTLSWAAQQIASNLAG